MKKLILAIAIIASGFSTFALSINQIQSEIVTASTTEEFREISIESLPNAIITALEKDYSTAKIGNAYVNSKEQYKIEIYMQPTDNIVFANKDGHWLKRAEIEASSTLNSII